MPHAASLLIPRLGRYGSTELLRHAIVLRSGQPGFQAHRCINTNLASRVAWFLAKDTLTIIDLFATRFGQRSTTRQGAVADCRGLVQSDRSGSRTSCHMRPGTRENASMLQLWQRSLPAHHAASKTHPWSTKLDHWRRCNRAAHKAGILRTIPHQTGVQVQVCY